MQGFGLWHESCDPDSKSGKRKSRKTTKRIKLPKPLKEMTAEEYEAHCQSGGF